MDDPAADEIELAEALAWIRLVNRRLGGEAALMRHLAGWSRDWPTDRPIEVLDIATGSADLPLAAARWAARAGREIRIIAIDVHETTLRLAEEHVSRSPQLAPKIEIRRMDAFELLEHFPTGSFDCVHAGLFLHHLGELRIMTLLRIMERLSRDGVIWNDLVRSPIARAFIHVATIGRPTMVRHDARASVAAGFTRGEAVDLAQRAWEHRPRWRWNPLTHRFTVTCRRSGR